MTTGVGTTLTMGYDGLRRLTSVTGGPVSRQYTYRDIDSAKTTMQVASVTSGGQQYGYTYDSMGNIATYSAPGKATVTYTYDSQGQLLKATGDTTYTYTYDGAGNILTASDGTTTHIYNYEDATWKDLLTGYDRRAITYDAIGNPTSYYNGTNWDFTWANGRSLTTASGRVYNLSFTYDANGLRASKTDGGIVYRYYYAGEKLIRMTWGANIVDLFYDVNGTPYAMKRNGFVYYYITNLQGDVLKLVDASGNVVASYEYDPYGKILSSTGSLATVNPLRYRGYVYDQETGFYYLQSRYYDPAIGRFLNADSYASTGQGIIGNNMFAYCGCCPIRWRDSTGCFLDTIIDIASFGLSINDVYANPSDPFAWLGFVGDFVDILIPFAGGLGESARLLRAANQAASAYGDLSRAADYGIDSYKGLRKVIQGTGLEAHHIIEKRLVQLMSIDTNSMLSVSLTLAEHRKFTNAWREWFPYGMDYSTVTIAELWDAAQEIYKDYPALLDAAWVILFG